RANPGRLAPARASHRRQTHATRNDGRPGPRHALVTRSGARNSASGARIARTAKHTRFNGGLNTTQIMNTKTFLALPLYSDVDPLFLACVVSWTQAKVFAHIA